MYYLFLKAHGGPRGKLCALFRTDSFPKKNYQRVVFLSNLFYPHIKPLIGRVQYIECSLLFSTNCGFHTTPEKFVFEENLSGEITWLWCHHFWKASFSNVFVHNSIFKFLHCVEQSMWKVVLSWKISVGLKSNLTHKVVFCIQIFFCIVWKRLQGC